MKMYAACLASYNNGTLHGAWIDLVDKGVEEIGLEIAEMLRASPYPNVEVDCPECHGAGKVDGPAVRGAMGGTYERVTCDHCRGSGKVPSAEEWAAHDYDGKGLGDFGEYPDLDQLLEHVRMYEEHGVAYLAYVSHVGAYFATEDDFSDKYYGCYQSREDWADEFMHETMDIPEHLSNYIDYESYVRDCELGGDMAFVDYDGELYVFRGC